MKKSFIFLMSAVAALSLTGCHHTHREPANPASQEKALIVPTVALSDYSRAASDLQSAAFHEQTKAGFFVNDADNNVLHANVKHGVYSGSFKTEGEVMYWPTSGKDLTIYAYAPYADATTLADDIAFSVASDQTGPVGFLKSDLLIGTPSASNPVSNTAYTTTGASRVPMTFTHKMSKVTLNFKANAATVAFTDGKATINAATACKFNVSTGTVSAATAPAVSDITVSLAVEVDGSATDTYTCSAIIVPQTIAADTQFITLTTNNAEFTVKLADAVTFQSGYEYVFNIGLDPKKVELTTEVDKLNNWNSATEINATAERTQVIKVGDYLMQDGTYESSPSSKPEKAIGMVIKTDNFSNGYKALVLSVLSLNETPYAFGSGSLGTDYVANSTGITSSVRSGLDMLTTIESNFGKFTAFNNTLNNSAVPHYKAPTPSNASKWFIPSAYEMKLILEFFSPENATWSTSDQTLTEHGATTIPGAYTNANIYNNFPINTGNETLYWTCTPVDANKVWVGAINHSTFPVALRQKARSETAYVVPILYSK